MAFKEFCALQYPKKSNLPIQGSCLAIIVLSRKARVGSGDALQEKSKRWERIAGC